MKKIHIGTLKNYDYLGTTFTSSELAPVWNEVNVLLNDFSTGNKYNNFLAGNLDYEFRLLHTEKYVGELMRPFAHEYMARYEENLDVSKLCLDTVWVNFQKKHEFNPPHKHHSLLSFVIWLQVPYSIEDELASRPHVPAERNFSGQFMFHYTNVVGQLNHHNIPADKKYNGLGMIFPGSLTHSVLPFYSSDDFRISIAGNFNYES